MKISRYLILDDTEIEVVDFTYSINLHYNDEGKEMYKIVVGSAVTTNTILQDSVGKKSFDIVFVDENEMFKFKDLCITQSVMGLGHEYGYSFVANDVEKLN